MTLSSVKYCVYQYNSTRNVFLIITGMQLSWILSHLMRHYRQPLYMLALVHVLCELLDVSLLGGGVHCKCAELSAKTGNRFECVTLSK